MKHVTAFRVIIGWSMCLILFSMAAHATKSPTVLKKGDYLRADFMRTVQTTHSTLRLPQQNEVLLVIVSAGEKGVCFQEIANFHEGITPFELLPSSNLEQIPGIDCATLSLDVKSNRSFSLRCGDEPERLFKWVGSTEQWVVQHTVAGSYKDCAGQRYTFEENGRAEFPEKTFSYTVAIDHIGQPYDCIHGDSHLWVYKFESDTLSLFVASSTDITQVDDKPLLVLRKMSKTEGVRRPHAST